MAYTALYRKFRPSTFKEMVGQEHITKTLKNQIMAGRVGHAYLFNGGRGTGKTSAAKVLARAINCLNPQQGEPCNECEICKAALSGSLTDIVEMDAASNNSVEDIRSIREEVNFLPTQAKYRVYIIDEVHMLSTGAFNALLKTLEEPPEHVKFILATTEPQKLPATILSRCQRFDFKKISTQNIIKRLEIIASQSNFTVTKEAMQVIAVLAEGAMRDALSILERCIQDGENEIDENKVKELVGIPKLTYIHQITKSILQYNVEEALEVTHKVLEEGKDLENFLWEIIKYNKDILVYQAKGILEIYSEAEKNQIDELSKLVTKERLLKLIYNLSELQNEMKWSTQKTILFETGIIKNCMKEETGTIEERIEKIEEELARIEKQGINIKAEQKNNQVIKENELKYATQQTEKKKILTEKMEKNSNIQPGEYVSYWSNVIQNLKQQGKVMLYTNLLNTKAKELDDMTLGIEFPNGITAFGKTVLEKDENKRELIRIASMEAGKEMRIKYLDKKETKEQQADSLDDLTTGLGISINIIDE